MQALEGEQRDCGTSVTRESAGHQVGALMRDAGIDGPQACPRGLRHSFGVAAVTAGVPNDGDIVLARIGPEGTLKRYERIDAETVELQPVSTNSEHKPIQVGPTTEDAEIVGIVVGAIVGTRRAAE